MAEIQYLLLLFLRRFRMILGSNETTKFISFPSKRLNGLVNFVVISSTYYHHIFQSVVVSNLIDVMNMFRVFQRSSQMFFHYQTVFKFPMATHPNLNISPTMHSLITLGSAADSAFPQMTKNTLFPPMEICSSTLSRAKLIFIQSRFPRLSTLGTLLFLQLTRCSQTSITTIFSICSYLFKDFVALRTSKSIHKVLYNI